jgi:hypothetical protein
MASQLITKGIEVANFNWQRHSQRTRIIIRPFHPRTSTGAIALIQGRGEAIRMRRNIYNRHQDGYVITISICKNHPMRLKKKKRGGL